MTCNRCHGLLVYEFDEVPTLRCYCCGNRLLEHVADPMMPNPNRSWDSTLCGTCHLVAAVRGKEQCRNCRPRPSGPEHGKRISEGMAVARSKA
jgi:uncharacterized CHY-type Zn-finger protein